MPARAARAQAVALSNTPPRAARCEVRVADLRCRADWMVEANTDGIGAKYDLITGTPPYWRITHVHLDDGDGDGAGAEAAAAAAAAATAAASAPVLMGSGAVASMAAASSPAGATDGAAPTSGSDSQQARSAHAVPSTAPAALAAVGALPTCMQSAPARFEFRGGIEAYCEAASHALAPSPHARFVVCEGWLQGNRARVTGAAAACGLHILERLDVVGREGKAPLFAVYVMCHAHAVGEVGSTGVKERTIVVRGLDGERTAEYRELMLDMGMPS